MQTIEERLVSLERSAARFKKLAAALAMGCAGLILSGAGTPARDVTAGRVIIVDEDGKAVGMILGSKGACSIELDCGGKPFFACVPARPQGAGGLIQVTASDTTPTSLTSSVTMGVFKDHGGHLEITTNKDGGFVGMAAGDEGGQISTRDGAGKTTWSSASHQK